MKIFKMSRAETGIFGGKSEKKSKKKFGENKNPTDVGKFMIFQFSTAQLQ